MCLICGVYFSVNVPASIMLPFSNPSANYVTWSISASFEYLTISCSYLQPAWNRPTRNGCIKNEINS